MAIDLGPGIDLGLGIDLGKGIDLEGADVNLSQVIPQQEPKGFFATLRNPIELMRYESLPIAAYQYASGNTKEVQAKKAQDFIQANPTLQGTPEYMEAEAVLERYGYALSEQPFSLEALQAAVKTNPGAMAGEFVNAFMADPYLLFTPYALGGNALTKFMQANNILAKVPRIQRGVAIGTAAVPEAAAYSTVMQLGEKGELDANRVAVETAIGGAGALGLGILWGGSMNIIGRNTDEAKVTKETMQYIQERASRGETEAITELSDFAIGPSGIPNNFAKQLDKNLNRISENNSYSNKTTRAIQNEVEETIAENTNKFINYNNETTLAKKIYDKTVGPVVATTVFGTGGYIGTGEKEGALYAGATALALTSFGKVSSAAFKRYKDVQAGKNFVKNVVTQDDFAVFRKEVKDAGIKLDDTGIAPQINFYRSNAAKRKDFAELGELKRLIDLKGPAISRYAIDGVDQFVKVGNATSRRLNQLFRKENPVTKDRELHVLDWIQGNKNIKLSTDELRAATTAQNYFKQMHKVISEDEDLLLRFRNNYLPGFWQTSAFDSEEAIMKQLQSFLTESSSIQQYKGRLAAENSKLINSYAEGIAKGLKPRSTNLGDIIQVYNNAVNKALAERRVVKLFYNTDINGRVTSKGDNYKFMYDELPTGVNAGDYIKFRHPAFEAHSPKNATTLKDINAQIKQSDLPVKDQYELKKKLIDEAYADGRMVEPFVFKEAATHLKFMFDATESKGLHRAISNINFLQKRFSVGYSFFHAAALMESMIFAGVGVTRALNVPISYFRPKQNSAKRMINEGGNFDDYEAGLKAGVIFSHPDDIGHHAFYDTVQGANRLADRTGSPLVKWTVDQGIDKLVTKPFKFIDDVTWDHVYNSGKLYTFQTARHKLLKDPANKDIPLVELNRKAAKFTNDAYGGLNWRQLYEDIENPIMKSLTGKMLTVSGRRNMQLLMFAPDWTIANLRILGNALPGFNKDPVARKLYQAYAIRAGLIYATFGSALQYMFTGKSLLENKDPTKIDLGNGDTMVWSKQLMEPLHWAVHPYKTLVSKQGSTLKLTQQLLFNKKFLTSPYPSPISEEDLFSLYRARDYGEQIGKSFLPFAIRGVVEKLQKDDLHYQDAINVIIGQFGHPIYQEGRFNKYQGLNNIILD